METHYFTHNGIGVAAIDKSGSSAIARAILFDVQPDYEVRSASGNQANVDRSLNHSKWQTLVSKTEDPTNPIIPVRDPVERFRSACAQEGVTAEEQLVRVEAGGFNFLTRKTSGYLRDGARLYKFPEQLDGIAAELGLDEIPSVNDSETNNAPKPDLTPEQLTRVQAIYADDIALFESITEAGQVYAAPPIPVTDEEKTAKIAAFDAHSLAECASDILVDGLGVFHVDADTVHDLNTVRRIVNGDIVGLPAGTVVDGKYHGYKTVTGDSVNLGIPELDLIELAVISRKAGHYSFQRPAIVAAVNAATNQDELDAITW